MTKKCTKCGEEKDIDEFGPKKTSPDGHTTRCRKCLAQIKREWVHRPKKEKEIIPEGFHKCSKCGEVKELDKFHKRTKCKDGYSHTCLECDNKYNDKWRLKNREQHLQNRKNWYNANIDKERARMLAYHKKNYAKLAIKWKEWVANNKDKHRISQKEYRNNVLAKDPKYRLVWRCRGRIYAALKNGYKSAHTAELLGVSINEFTSYITNLFTDGMTWEKFMNGEIELDHIRPIASFDFNNPIAQYVCFNYRNHQPLWSSDNRAKSSKWSSGSQLLWKNTIGEDIKQDLISRGIIDSSYEGC
jgi:hypothetical protein